jgi:hypothetical protein
MTPASKCSTLPLSKSIDQRERKKMNTTNSEKGAVWRGLATNEKSAVWRRIAIVTLLLLALVGPNFGPLPHALRQSLSLEGTITAVLICFWVAFMIILAVILRMIGSTSIREFLNSHGLGAPSGIGANIAGLILGLLWGMLFLSSIFQFDPDANITQINGFRILTAFLAAGGALLEDLITRSFIMNHLHKIGSSKWVSSHSCTQPCCPHF